MTEHGSTGRSLMKYYQLFFANLESCSTLLLIQWSRSIQKADHWFQMRITYFHHCFQFIFTLFMLYSAFNLFSLYLCYILTFFTIFSPRFNIVLHIQTSKSAVIYFISCVLLLLRITNIKNNINFYQSFFFSNFQVECKFFESNFYYSVSLHQFRRGQRVDGWIFLYLLLFILSHRTHKQKTQTIFGRTVSAMKCVNFCVYSSLFFPWTILNGTFYHFFAVKSIFLSDFQIKFVWFWFFICFKARGWMGGFFLHLNQFELIVRIFHFFFQKQFHGKRVAGRNFHEKIYFNLTYRLDCLCDFDQNFLTWFFWLYPFLSSCSRSQNFMILCYIQFFICK